MSGPPTPEPPLRERRVYAGTLGFVVSALAGYALHRLGFHLAGEPDPRVIVHADHVGYYWRVATAAWWGLIGAALAARFPEVAPHLARVWPLAFLLAVAVALLVP